MTTVSDSLPKLRLKIKFISKTTQDAKLVGSNSVKDGFRCLKRGPSGVEDAVLNKRPKMDRSSLKRDCGNILDALIKHPASYGFCEPVDPVKLNIPDYFSIISKPMDLGTVRTKLQKNMYLTDVEFKEDVKLTFSNAMLFNPPGNFFHKNAMTLDAIFNTKWKSQLKRESCQESCLTSFGERKTTESRHLCPFVEKRKLIKEPEAKVTDNVKISYARPPPARRTQNTCKSDPESDVALDEERNCSSPQPSSVCTTAASADACWTPAVDIQLSPKKAQRASMLRKRFADTILKAKKTLLDHVDKVDPVNLRQEKQKLERQQQEEKERIENQIRAAKVASSLKAREELRLRREREREAARIALQQMEKTAEIEDNMKVLKELEMVLFKAGQGARFGNIMEQIGLFLKNDYMDYEDEEDGQFLQDWEEGQICN
ncbi:hypothetical protein POM88_019949 [Heracleum sosnowskyi]|uniref:Bromo domain-containing protein n=1 Tax=Heracleum sosnowskyi TaxID=360622 RepID=A0AAD8IBU2_9APIA|nr:hypothetical protein POM88_019949 [Heracleum sosnowskyi]